MARLAASYHQAAPQTATPANPSVAASCDMQAALMALGLPADIAEILANEDIEYALLAERIVAVGIEVLP